MIIVAITDPHDPQATALLKQSHALMESLFPPEDNFFLDIDDLCADHIHFFTARIGDQIFGTGAIAMKDGYAEIKSMFVDEAACRPQTVCAARLFQLRTLWRLRRGALIRLHGKTPDMTHSPALFLFKITAGIAPNAHSAFFVSAAAFMRASNSTFVSRPPNGFLPEPCALCSL